MLVFDRGGYGAYFFSDLSEKLYSRGGHHQILHRHWPMIQFWLFASRPPILLPKTQVLECLTNYIRILDRKISSSCFAEPNLHVSVKKLQNILTSARSAGLFEIEYSKIELSRSAVFAYS
jgi:hypothetical protein